MALHTPPHKTLAADPGAQHRLRMCELAIAGEPGLAASALEVERGGASYTVDTLRAIRATHPDARLTLIMGADTAGTLAAWREPAELLELAELAVAMRAGSAPTQVLDAVAAAAGPDHARGTEVRFLEMQPVEVSSSTVRQRAARGEPLDGLVAPAVARYIAEHGLYRAPIEVA